MHLIILAVTYSSPIRKRLCIWRTSLPGTMPADRVTKLPYDCLTRIAAALVKPSSSTVLSPSPGLGAFALACRTCSEASQSALLQSLRAEMISILDGPRGRRKVLLRDKLCACPYVEVADGSTTIGEYAFCNCTTLTSLPLPETLTTIATGAFACSSLSYISLPQHVVAIGCDAFFAAQSLRSINVPPFVTCIGRDAFSQSGLAAISVPPSVTRLGTGAFQLCKSLAMVQLYATIEVIEERCFCDCSSLKSIQLPSGLRRIDAAAFMRCTSLTSVLLPPSLTSIGMYAFKGCTGLDAASREAIQAIAPHVSDFEYPI